MRLRRFARSADALALKALLWTLCVPAAALTIVAASVAAGILRGGIFVLITMQLGVGLSSPGLRCMRHLRRRALQEPAGVPVDAAAEPELLALVAQECRAVGAAMPAAVHLSLEHSVRLTRARGVRTLVVGAPLAVTVPEPVLRVAVSHAVLRDASRLTRLLDPWAHALLESAYTWAAIAVLRPWRTLAQAAWKRVAAALRARTLQFDVQCARRLGSAAAAAYVRLQPRVWLFADDYWGDQVAPCLDAGFRPPVLAGWRRLLDDPATADFIVAELTRDLDEQPRADSPRPTLGARLAAIEVCAPTGGSLGSALSLRRSASAVEEAALRASDGTASSALVEIAWERVAEAVWLPRMRAAVAPWHDALDGSVVADLRSLVQRDDVPLPVLGAALAVTLHEHGWELLLGADAVLRAASEEHELLVLEVADCLAREGDDEREWERFVEDAELSELPLRPRGDDPAEPATAGGSIADWPMLTVPASMPLRRTRAVRRRTLVALTIVGVLGGSVCATMLAIALAGTGENLQLFYSIVGPVATCMLLVWAFGRMRLTFGRRSLSITGDALRVEDRGLLRRPLEIERSQVRAVAVDDGVTVSVIGTPLRFAFGTSQWLHPATAAQAADGWLWSGPHTGSVPMLGVGDEVPNVLLVFSEPVKIPRLRRRAGGLPKRGRPLMGLALCVDDAAAAHRAFAGWGVVRPLSREDARPLLAS